MLCLYFADFIHLLEFYHQPFPLFVMLGITSTCGVHVSCPFWQQHLMFQFKNGALPIPYTNLPSNLQIPIVGLNSWIESWIVTFLCKSSMPTGFHYGASITVGSNLNHDIDGYLYDL